MTQIRSIKLGLIAMCVATVPLSLAQTPRTGTSGSNQTGVAMRPTVGHSGLSGTSTSGTQFGTNFRSGTSTVPNTNFGAHTGMNAGPQIGIGNQTGGVTGGAVGGLGGSGNNSTVVTPIGANARAGTTTTTNSNAGTRTGGAAAAPSRATTILPQLAAVPIRSRLPNNSPASSNFSTAGQSPSPLPSLSVTPTPTLTPTQLLGG